MEEKQQLNEGGSNRIISPMMLITKNKAEITILLKQIAKEHRITVDEAAMALSEALKRFINH